MVVSDFMVEIIEDYACVSPIYSEIFCTRFCCKQIYFAFACSLYHFRNTEKTFRCAES